MYQNSKAEKESFWNFVSYRGANAKGCQIQLRRFCYLGNGLGTLQ
jgi:hypothetical protein